MATSGSLTTSSWYSDADYTRNYTLSWTAKQDPATNKSTITWTLKAGGTYEHNVAERTLKAVINGTTVYSKTDRVMRGPGTVASGTIVIAHDEDGEKTFTASVQAAVYYSTVNCTGSKSFTLTTIPRATTPTFSSSSPYMNTAITITMNRAVSTYTHSLYYNMGSTGDVEIGTGLGTSTEWTIPLELANQLPNATSGTCKIICKTYSGTSLIGTKTVNLTIKVPEDILPTFAEISHSEAVSAVAETFGVYVQNRSKLNISIVGASGSYSSTIKACLIEVAGQTIEAVNGTSDAISKSGALEIRATVTDTRGRSYSSACEIYVTPYTLPYFQNIEISRGDTTAVISASGSCSSVLNDNAEKNGFVYLIEVKEKSSLTWTSLGTVDTEALAYGLNAEITDLDPQKSYEFNLYAGDKLLFSTPYSLAVSTAIVPFDFDVKKGRLGIRKTLEYEDSLIEVPDDAILYVGEQALDLKNLVLFVEEVDINGL